MRLYAVVKSERAKHGRGVGGNEEIIVEFFVGSAEESLKVAEARLKPKGVEYTLDVFTASKAQRFLITEADLVKVEIAGEVIAEEKLNSEKPKSDIEF